VNPHLERVLDAMADAGVDVLLLGREANARYVTGADRLSVAGSRAFAPGCVVVRETSAVHLLSISDDGIPADIPPAHFYPISWNPMNILGGIVEVPGVADARSIGVDGLTPLFEQLIHGMVPGAAIIDGEALLREIRQAKTDEDVDGIRAAVDVAEQALRAAFDALAPGVTERELKGRFEEAMASLGARTPSFEGTFCVADPGAPPRSMVTDRAVEDGDLVHFRVGVMRDGWEGAIARTVTCGGDAPETPPAHATTIALAVDGATVGDLRATGATVEGVGIGHEELDDPERLEPGIVLFIERYADPVLIGDTVLVGEDSPEVLTNNLALGA
jgi:Xaa-Pro aminopeptidase